LAQFFLRHGVHSHCSPDASSCTENFKYVYGSVTVRHEANDLKVCDLNRRD